MRVAFLSFDFGEYCVRLTSALARHAEVCLLLNSKRFAPHRAKLDPAVRVVPFDLPRLRHPYRQCRLTVDLLRAIHRFQPDVVHVQQGHLWFNFGLPALRSYPLVVTIHDVRQHLGDKGAHNTPQWVLDFGFRRATRLIVHGETLRRKVAKDLAIASDRVHVIPMILHGDPDSCSEVAAEPATVLFFGRIWQYKGLEYLIRAEPLISQLIPEVKFVIAGEGEDFTKYRRLMVHPDRFVVHNTYIPHDVRDVLFRQATVVVLPYVEASQSGVIPFAYTFERPVVATTVGALPDIVDDGQTGLLVPPADVERLAAAVVRLLRDEPLRRRLAMNGRRKLEVECSPDVIAAQTLAAYRMAIGTDRAEPRLSVEMTRETRDV